MLSSKTNETEKFHDQKLTPHLVLDTVPEERASVVLLFFVSPKPNSARHVVKAQLIHI